MANLLYVSEDNVITLDALTNSTTGEYVNDATITMTLTTEAGVAVDDALNLEVTYVSDSDGLYRGTLPNTLELSEGVRYYLILSGSSGASNLYRKILFTAIHHENI